MTQIADGRNARRMRTRRVLLEAAAELVSEGKENASIEEITRRAGVGFGSFFNHFPGGKAELFEEAILERLDLYTTWLRSTTENLDDPAEIFARSFRLTGRLALAHPDMLRPLLSRGTELLLVERGLREAAIDDIKAGVASGRFVDLNPDLLLVGVGGSLLGLVRLVSETPDEINESAIDAVAASALRFLGVDAAEANELAARELPALPAV